MKKSASGRMVSPGADAKQYLAATDQTSPSTVCKAKIHGLERFVKAF